MDINIAGITGFYGQVDSVTGDSRGVRGPCPALGAVVIPVMNVHHSLYTPQSY